MARKSKYGAELAPLKKSWQAAVYIRLSREDGDKEESDSVTNQRSLLCDYISSETDIDIYDIYIDDGYSGTNFDRPAFIRMMEDIKARAVNCVVVKDLSRFGREYVEVGNYIEKVFPFLDIRFVSLNDNLDSIKNPQGMNNLIVPFKSIINDEYCRDISNKVRSSLDIKRKQGKFIGSFASYGYMKSASDHNRLVIDEYAASVVRDIYKWFIEGTGIIRIAKRLNEQGVLNPTVYKRSLGINYRHPAAEAGSGLWCDTTVRRILKNRMYTGTLVQGKSRVKSYKVQISVSQPEQNWIEVEGTHEAIIDKAVYDKAQSLLTRDMRTSPKEKKLYLFSGFLRCADCGRAMNRKLVSQPYGDYHYFICSTFKKMKDACTKHTVRSDKLEEAVLTTIRQQIQLAVSMDEVVARINKGQPRKDSKRLIKALSDKEAERRKLESLKLGLYPDWKNGDITRDEYLSMKAQFDAQLMLAVEVIENIRQEIEEFENGIDSANAFISNFSKFKFIDILSRELLAELVDYIYIHEGGAITIQFKYADEFEKAAEFIENNSAISPDWTAQAVNR